MKFSEPKVASICLVVCAAVLAYGVSAQSQGETLLGHWEGSLVREGAQLAVSFDFTSGAEGIEGTFSAASQRALGIPLDTVTIDATSVHFVLDGTLVFDGTLQAAGLRGGFRDGDATGTFELRRAIPMPPPYRVMEITFRNGDVVLSGTTFIPASRGPFPGVCLTMAPVPKRDLPPGFGRTILLVEESRR